MNETQYTAKDFKAGQPRWCPGCGDHAILSSLLNVFPKTHHRKENICNFIKLCYNIA